MSDVIEQVQQPNAGTIIPGEVPSTPDVPEVQSRAKSMGWVDKDSYRGPAEKWVDAEEFVRRGEEELPVLRERNRDLSRKYTELESKTTKLERDFNERVRRQEAMAQIALQQQRDTLEGQYEAAKRNAVEIGDTQRYEQLNRDQRQAIANFDNRYYQAVAPNQPQQGAGQPLDEVQAKVDAWIVENPWFTTDQGLNQYAQAVHLHLQRTKPDLTLEENFAAVAKMVRDQFPEKFGRGGGGPAAVEGGNGMATGGKRAKGVSDLPPEARRAADEFVRAGAFKNVAEYAKSYWSME